MNPSQIAELQPLAPVDLAQTASQCADAPEPPDDGELEAWRSAADALLRCSSSDAGLTRRAAFLLQNAFRFGSAVRESLHKRRLGRETSSRRLDQLSVSFWVSIGTLALGASERDVELQYAQHVAAFNELDRRLASIPGYMEQLSDRDGGFAVPRYELAEELEWSERHGVMCFPVTILAHKELPAELLAATRDAVLAAYSATVVGSDTRILEVTARRTYIVSESQTVELAQP